MITEKIKSELCSTKNVRTPSDIRSLADEAANAVLILDASALYPEIDTQRTISNVVQRLAVHFGTRWCEKAIAYKRNHDKYPDFKEFVSFQDIIASEVNDPIYGFGCLSSDLKPRSTCRATAASPHVPKPRCPLCSKNHWLHK